MQHNTLVEELDDSWNDGYSEGVLVGSNMRNDIIKAMQEVVDMYWSEEQRNWEELEEPDDHLFHAFNTFKNYLIRRANDNSKSNEVE